MRTGRLGPTVFVSVNTDITGSQRERERERGQWGVAGHRAAEKQRLQKSRGEEERAAVFEERLLR